jgi:hypothetical protein
VSLQHILLLLAAVVRDLMVDQAEEPVAILHQYFH